MSHVTTETRIRRVFHLRSEISRAVNPITCSLKEARDNMKSSPSFQSDSADIFSKMYGSNSFVPVDNVGTFRCRIYDKATVSARVMRVGYGNLSRVIS